MKRCFLFLSLFAGVCVAKAQSVGINTTPNATAALDVSSTTKGILVPRMNTTQRTNIATANGVGAPATGLLVYDTQLSAFFYYNGSAWTQVGGSSQASGTALSFTSTVGASNGNGNGTFYVGPTGMSANEQDQHRLLATAASTVTLIAAANGPLTSSYTLSLRRGTPSNGSYIYSDLSSNTIVISGGTPQTLTVSGLSLVAGETLSVRLTGTATVSAQSKALYFSFTAQ